MDMWKFFGIGHTHHVFCNPMSEEKFDEILALVTTALGGRSAAWLDIACGKGEFLLRLAERTRASGVGIEIHDPWAQEARDRAVARGVAERLEFVTQDGSKYEAPDAHFAGASCFGASWIFGGHRGTLDALARWVVPGGLVIAGEPYWRCEPTADYLAAEGVQADTFATHAGNIEIGEAAGLRFLDAIVSSEDDWDRYEGLQTFAAELWADAHPDDPDRPELMETFRKRRDAYLQMGREQLGWAVYLFLKPSQGDAGAAG